MMANCGKTRSHMILICFALIAVVPLSFGGNISISHIGTELLGAGRLIKGTTKGCTGVESTLTVYYGLTDGEISSGEWDQSIGREETIGADGSFSIALPRVNRDLQYYYRCHVSNSLGIAWAPESGQFSATAPGYTRSEVDAMAEAFKQEWLSDMANDATTRMDRIFFSERFLHEGRNVDTYEAWMDEYNGEILDPPWDFDVDEPFVYDNSTVSNALRSVIYAGHEMDYEGLNNLTNDDYIKNRNEFYNQPAPVIEKMYQLMVHPEMLAASRMTVLLVGHLEWEDDEYICFLTRRSHWESPRTKVYGFKYVIFRHDSDNNIYWETSDLESSKIKSFLLIAGPSGAHRSKMSGTYQEMYDYYKDSDVPAHFYTFGEE